MPPLRSPSFTVALTLFLMASGPASADEDQHVPNPGYTGDPKALSPPIVDGPLYECGSSVSVRGAVPGATIVLIVNGATVNQTLSAEGGATFAVSLKDQDVVTAKQELDGYWSTESNKVTVKRYRVDFPNGVPKPTFLTPSYACGQITGLYSAIHGSSVQLYSETLLAPPSTYATPVTVASSQNSGPYGAAARVAPQFKKDARLSATAEMCGEVSPLSDFDYVEPDPGPLSAPALYDVFDGQKVIGIKDVTNGAYVIVVSGTEILFEGPGAGAMAIRLTRPAQAGETLEATQELCSAPADSSSVEVKECGLLMAPTVQPVQPGDKSVHVNNAVPGARITVFDQGGNEIGDGSGSEIVLIRAIQAGEQLYVVQTLGECQSYNAYKVQVGCLPGGVPFQYPCGSQPCARGQFPSACWRPYGPESAFNRPVPSNPPLRPNSQAIMARVFGDLASQHDRPTDFWIPPDGTQGWPTYYGQASDPEFTIQCNSTNYGPCDVDKFRFRAPAGAQNQNNTVLAGDRHLTVIDQTSGVEYDMWEVITNPLPSTGGAISTSFSGYTMAMEGDGRAIGLGEGNAGQVGNLAGRIRAEEFLDAVNKDSYINHALAINVECTDGTWVYPTRSNKGRMCDVEPLSLPLTDAPPMGARVWLSMSFSEIEILPIPIWKKVILRTLSKYGAVIMDTGTQGHAFAWQREAGNQYTSMGAPNDAWLSLGAALQGQEDWVAINNNEYIGSWDNSGNAPHWRTIVWSRLRVVDACVSSGSCGEWYYRDEFRRLEVWPGTEKHLVALVDGISHPSTTSYSNLPVGDAAFSTFSNALVTAARSLAVDATTPVDWCAVRAAAAQAGYTLYRFRHQDSTSPEESAWLIYARPTQADQAHFFFNPSAKRNIVIEVPHAGTEADVDEQGARVMLQSGAFALLVNGHDRCSQAATTTCSGGPASTAVCGTYQDYRHSDVAHATDNAFHAMHLELQGQPAVPNGQTTRFVSLHGKKTEPELHISDGSTATSSTMSVSSLLADELVTPIGENSLYRCQEETSPHHGGDPLCGTRNIQGIEANAPTNQCTATASTASGRFLHIEQPQSFRDLDKVTGTLVTALTSMQGDFDACDLGEGPSDCTPDLAQQAPLPNPNLNCGP